MEQQNLFKGRDKRNKGWFWLDNDYLNGYARFFGSTGTAIYVSLCRHADSQTQKCYPAIKMIAEENNIGESTVKNYIKIFKKYRLITIERKRDERTKKWLHNEYTLLDKSEWITPQKPLKQKRKKSQSQPLDVGEPEPKNIKSQSQTLALHKETHKKETQLISNASVAVNKTIELFKNVNPSYEKLFKNKTQRSALERLLKKYGEVKVKGMLEFAAIIQSEKYAPTITTPLQLEDKLGSLLAYYKKKKSEVPLVIEV